MSKNPVAQNGMPMGCSMCTCEHVYVAHVKNASEAERKCLVSGCDCMAFALMPDKKYRDSMQPTEDAIAAEYTRVQVAMYKAAGFVEIIIGSKP